MIAAFLVCSHARDGEGEQNVRRMLADAPHAVYHGRGSKAKDTAILDVDDGYFGLVEKRGAMLRDGLERFPDADYLVKIDTDVVIWPEAFGALLAEDGADLVARHASFCGTYAGACMAYSRRAAEWVADCTESKVPGLSPADVRFKRESRNIAGEIGPNIMYAEDYHATTCLERHPILCQSISDTNRIAAYAWRGWHRGRRVPANVAAVFELPPADQMFVHGLGPEAAAKHLMQAQRLSAMCRGCYAHQQPQERDVGCGRLDSPLSSRCVSQGDEQAVRLTTGGCPMGYF